MTIVSLLLAQFPGRYSGGSPKTLSKYNVTQLSVMLSLLAGKFEGGPGDPAVVQAPRVCDKTDNKSPFTVIFTLSIAKLDLGSFIPIL
jgi:hypothetical protein